MERSATACALAAILLLGGCAVLPPPPAPFRAAEPGAFQDAAPAGPPQAAAPSDGAGRSWSGFASFSAWWLSSDGRGSTPTGSGGGPEGDGEGLSFRAGATFDVLRDPNADPKATNPFGWLPEGWRPCWGVEAEYLDASSSGSGADDPSLDARSGELLIPLGIRRPGRWGGDDGHRFDLLFGGALRSLDLEDGDLAAVGAEDSPSVGSLVFGTRARVDLGARVFVFARGDLGGFVVHDDAGSGSEVDRAGTGHGQWMAGVGVRLSPRISIQSGWRSLVLERREEEDLSTRQNPNNIRVTETRVEIEGGYLEVEIRF
jgi:hypothetical protein